MSGINNVITYFKHKQIQITPVCFKITFNSNDCHISELYKRIEKKLLVTSLINSLVLKYFLMIVKALLSIWIL
jgi:hypothetical protein